MGIATEETDRDIAFCSHTILDPEEALVVGDPRLMAYAGAPMVAPDGTVIGTVCAMDIEPRVYTPDQVATLRRVAAQVVDLRETTRAADR